MIENKQWSVKVIKDNILYPFLIVDNWYTEEEEKSIWQELNYYLSVGKKNLKRAENTVVATKNDIPLSNAFRIYLENFYTKEGFENSTIFKCTYKQKTKQFLDHIKNCVPYGRTFKDSNGVSTLISYYEENDYYDTHYDNFQWTNCIWMCKEPKKFNGGDFELPEIKTKILLKNNRAIFFPSCFEHKSNVIKFNEKINDIGFGKFTITHFYYSFPSGQL